ncbi:MAG: DUF1993 domain-containing protein [Xanthobacteraceae bacterium]|nr:DUF1993 domain-containing protein [Xanthobacteraceae bacterium]
MPLSMSQSSIPLFVRALRNLSEILKKGEEHPNAASFVEARLAPDMLTLAGQIQRASDAAKGCAARLSATQAPSFPDTEKTFPELQERIRETIDYLRSVPASQIDGSEERAISFKAGPNEYNFTGVQYLQGFAIPNFFFHVTTAYAILRHKGVALGKMDFLGTR